MNTKVQRLKATAPEAPAAPIGEIVEASTTGFKAVAAERFDPPPFGSFVRTTAELVTTFAVVSHVQHASIDPTRRAIPLGRTWDELRREQPQVIELLTTEFDAAAVAFTEGGSGGASPIHDGGPDSSRGAPPKRTGGSGGAGAVLNQFLPPAPPRVHDFVYVCATGEILALTDDLSFIRTLASAPAQAPEELIAAAIRGAAEARDDRRGFLLRAGREVADLYRQDYEQARSVLRRLGMRVAGDGWDHKPPDKVDLRRESEK